jgi:hypothetical protein
MAALNFTDPPQQPGAGDYDIILEKKEGLVKRIIGGT